MSQYYITKKDSDTGIKLQSIAEKRELCHKEQVALADKYGFKSWRASNWSAFGGMSSCANFISTPDPKIWGKGSTVGEYFPKKNSTAGKKAYEEIKALLVVEYEELNKCVGFNCDDFWCVGFAEGSGEYFGFEKEESWKFKIPDDCQEVTITRYRELFN